MGTKKDSTQNGDAGVRRSISRRFNDVLAGRATLRKMGDQRSARKLNRYRKELKYGKKTGDKPLSPLEVAVRVHELLESGERIADIRALAKPRAIEYDESQMVGLVQELHSQYGFRPEAYRFAGVGNQTLVAAGILSEMPAKRGPRKKEEVSANKTQAGEPKRRAAKAGARRVAQASSSPTPTA